MVNGFVERFWLAMRECRETATLALLAIYRQSKVFSIAYYSLVSVGSVHFSSQTHQRLNLFFLTSTRSLLLGKALETSAYAFFEKNWLTVIRDNKQTNKKHVKTVKI